MTAAAHAPVMSAELVEALNPRDGGVYVDGTFGGGGHTQAILAAAECKVVAMDRDPQAVARADKLADHFPRRLIVIEGCFSDLDTLLHKNGFEKVDGVALDIGLSSIQLDDPARGFSFAKDGPLDMRMGAQGKTTAAKTAAAKTAAEWINSLGEKTLARVLAIYGEERAARKIARAIAAARDIRPFRRTGELAELISQIIPRAPGSKIHPATRSFQALRILANDELKELAAALAAAENLLTEGGRLVVISFHSLEDRIVKQFLRARQCPPPAPNRAMPPGEARIQPFSFQNRLRRVRRASAGEIALNPRARSARMRVGIRTAAPPYPAADNGFNLPDPLQPA